MPPVREAMLPPANRLFVDREKPQSVFEDAAFAIPKDKAIIRVFYGVGGQGKTALCRELWRKTDPSIEPSYTFLRRALVDLHGRPKTDSDLLLVWIRNAFANSNVALPCFDLALALAWEGTRGEQAFPALTKPWLARASTAANVGNEELGETAAELVGEAIGAIPGVGFLFRKIGAWTIETSKRGYLERTREHLQRLYRDGDLKPAHELSQLLPWMLAQDLNYHLRQNPEDRFVLFVDEYERVFDQGGASTRWSENPFDRHLRAFIQETNGLLVVFFSRERLPWSEHPDWRDDLKDDAQHLLGGLTDKDADDFLKAIPIADPRIRTAIVDGSRESVAKSAGVYPLMLDLQVEHWRNLVSGGLEAPEKFSVSAETFEGRCIEIIERVLRDYGDAMQATIERLSVARRFDREAFNLIVTTFQTGLPLDSFDRITELSFVSASNDGFFSLHNIVAEAIRERLDESKRQSSLNALLEHFSKRSTVESHFELRPSHATALGEAAFLRQCLGIKGYSDWLSEMIEPFETASLYAFAASLWREASLAVEEGLGPEHPETASSLNNLGIQLRNQGDYDAAKPLYERALAICEKALGAEHPSTATSLNNLAVLFRAQGQYDAAKPLYERALAIREKVLGAEHPLTASSLNNLAVLLRAQGDYDGAKSLSVRALAISEEVLGAEHPSTAATLNNLAGLLRAQGDYDGAKPLYQRALAIREKALGAEHPSTASSLNSLAGLLRDQGDYDAAKPLYERALAIFEKALGDEHPSTATSLNNLAGLLRAEGDRNGAKPLYERALAIREKALGSEHPSTATSLNNLAGLLRDQGDYDATKALYERALAIREKALGAEHPSIATSLNNLAVLLRTLGDYNGAKPLYERALTIREKALGAEHPSIVTSLNNLALLLQAQGAYDAAKPLSERALALSERALGAEHPSTAASLNSLALLLRAQGDYAGAKPLFERALAVRVKALGAEHPETATSLNNLAVLLRNEGNYEGAKPLFVRALAIREKILGAEHPSTASSLNNLAIQLRAQGDYAGARPLFERALAIREKSLGAEHPSTAKSLDNLADLLWDQGDREGAKLLHERALAIRARYKEIVEDDA